MTNLRMLETLADDPAERGPLQGILPGRCRVRRGRVWHCRARGAFGRARCARRGHQGRVVAPDHAQPVPVRRAGSSWPAQAIAFLVVEMNTGPDARTMSNWQSKGRIPVEFYGRLGGVVPFPDEILSEIQRMANDAA